MVICYWPLVGRDQECCWLHFLQCARQSPQGRIIRPQMSIVLKLKHADTEAAWRNTHVPPRITNSELLSGGDPSRGQVTLTTLIFLGLIHP